MFLAELSHQQHKQKHGADLAPLMGMPHKPASPASVMGSKLQHCNIHVLIQRKRSKYRAN